MVEAAVRIQHQPVHQSQSKSEAEGEKALDPEIEVLRDVELLDVRRFDFRVQGPPFHAGHVESEGDEDGIAGQEPNDIAETEILLNLQTATEEMQALMELLDPNGAEAAETAR